MERPSITYSHDTSFRAANGVEGQPKSHTQSLISTQVPCNLTRSQIALALVIQRSKPDGLSTSEYCQQLKTHVKTNKPSVPGPERYVDTVEFWKDQYVRLHGTTKVLEDKVWHLEMQPRAQKSCDGDDFSPNQILQCLHVDERGASAREVSQTHIHLSRKQASSEPAGKSELLRCEQETHFHTLVADTRLRLRVYAFRIVRHRLKLEQMLPAENNVEGIEQLAQTSCETIQLLDEMLSNCCIPLLHLHWSREGSILQAVLEQLIAQAGLAFLSCFKVLTELCRTILGRDKRDMLIYQMVMVFHRALDILRDLEGVQADAKTIFTDHSLYNQRHASINPEYTVSKYLAEMLASIAYALDWKAHQYSHHELLEGILFSLLERTGQLVSEAVFAEQVANSRSPGNITGSSSDRASSWVAGPETRYIVRILHAILGGSDKRDSVIRVLAASKSATEVRASGGNSVHFSEHKSDIITMAKTRIQNTLIQGCVGVPALDAMRLPIAPSLNSSVPTNDGTAQVSYGPDWFIETVWAMIGWDIVGSF